MAKGRAAERLQKDRRLQRIAESAESAWRINESGIAEPGTRIPFEIGRFNLSVEKIVRGLFFHKNQVPLPASYKVDIFPGNGFWGVQGFQEYLDSMEKPAGVGDDVFQCRCTRDSKDNFVTGWLLLFYKSVAVLAHTVPN